MAFKIIIICIVIAVVGVYAFNAYAERKQSFYGITFVVGEIGSGKTTYLAKEASRWLKFHGNVYSNTYIKGTMKLSVSDLATFSPPPYSLIIIDESGLEMNSRDFKKTEKGLIEFMKLSRHYKCRVIFCSQTFGDTDKQIREVATKVIFLRKIIVGELTMSLNVKGKIGIDSEGQPVMQWEISRLGGLFLLRPYRKMFDSFETKERPLLVSEYWDTPSGKEG